MSELLGRAGFFELVNAVLVRVGRQALDPDGPQRRVVVVEPDDRVLQILAGPGSGKTEMLVWRILYELLVVGSPADALLVTTFTRKAATELELRLVERCDLILEEAARRGVAVRDPHVHDVRVGTLHSLCDALLRDFDSSYMEFGTQLIDEPEALARMAREYRWTLGYASPPESGPANVICDTSEVAALFRPPGAGESWPSRDMQRVDLLRAAIAQHTETWIPRCADEDDRNGIEYVSHRLGITDALKSVCENWVEYLDKHAILDFTTIQQRFLERQDRVAQNLCHVFVDEFQDTNPIQFAIHVGWLKLQQTRLTVVGDDDQSIYRFRGSDIACFQDLQKECKERGVSFRLAKLEDNHRSTKTIVNLTEIFRGNSILGSLGMEKDLRPANEAVEGEPVRLLTGNWSSLCDVVASELQQEHERSGSELLPDAAVLLFSTSERNWRNRLAPASVMRAAFESAGLRVFNARNKVAGREGSPVHDLFALISYLIDPVRERRVPGRARPIEVCASHREVVRRRHADAVPPKYCSDDHAEIQKRFRKSGRRPLDNPLPERAELLNYVDSLRTALISYIDPESDHRRLTLSAFAARLISFRYFRNCGYTPQLFRQALFTSLLEANVAPTRRTMRSLDQPMRPMMVDGKVDWPRQFWDLLRVMGTMLKTTPLDDEEVEAFAENAIAMLTFHQAKGLEFDHMYVAATGRDVTPGNVLRTALFSGRSVPYCVRNGQPVTSDRDTMDLARADRERETYVALTRAKRDLTILWDPRHDNIGISRLTPALESIFAPLPASRHPLNPGVTVKTFTHVVAGGPR